MRSSTLLGVIVAAVTAISFDTSRVLTPSYVSAQEEGRDRNSAGDLFRHFDLRGGDTVFLPNWNSSDDINFDVLKALDTIIDETPDEFEARYYREIVYGQLGDVIRSRRDFQYILDHKEASAQAAKYSIGN